MKAIAKAAAPPLLSAPERIRLVYGLVVLVAATAGTAILFSYDPARYGFYPPCFFRSFTGLNCPGCGAMRAIHQLLHGHVLTAARFNLLLVLSLPGSVWWVARCGFLWLSGKSVIFDIRPAWLWTLFGIVTVFTILRNLPGFEWLAP
jgi:hypothetical protein